MGKKTCPKCNLEFEDTTGQKFERGAVIRMLKGIHVMGIDEKHEETKDYCYNCWKTGLRSLMKPFAEQLGKDASNW